MSSAAAVESDAGLDQVRDALARADPRQAFGHLGQRDVKAGLRTTENLHARRAWLQRIPAEQAEPQEPNSEAKERPRRGLGDNVRLWSEAQVVKLKVFRTNYLNAGNTGTRNAHGRERWPGQKRNSDHVAEADEFSQRIVGNKSSRIVAAATVIVDQIDRKVGNRIDEGGDKLPRD